MPKFHVLSQETIYYDSIIEAETEEEAQQIVLSGEHDLSGDISDSDYFEVTDAFIADDLPE